jgi:hypothetical protein
VIDLKQLQAMYQSMLAKHGTNSSSHHHSSHSDPAEAIKSQYVMWWECADGPVRLLGGPLWLVNGSCAPNTTVSVPVVCHIFVLISEGFAVGFIQGERHCHPQDDPYY